MRTRKINKKLVLTRETIANLRGEEMNGLFGGGTYKCPTDWLICDTYYDCTQTNFDLCTDSACP